MELRAAKLEASNDVVDNPRESAKVTSRALAHCGIIKKAARRTVDLIH
jgi:hypothetical protein